MLRRALLTLPLIAACGGDDDAAPGVPDADLDLTPATVTLGERCAPEDRAGVIGFTLGKGVRADLYDRTDPFIAAPAESDDVCAFHEYAPAEQCPPCDGDEVCGFEGACVAAPRRDTGARLVVRAGGDEQVFEAEPTTGELAGTITLPGDAFAFEVELFGQRVTLEEEASVPELLPGFTSALLGAYDAPEGIEASWDAIPAGSHLFTIIPINHHAAAPTFTECAVGGEVGEILIDQPMLEPLAVATGLEFQTFEHVRFGAAQTERGCVEVRFYQTQSVGLPGV